KNLVIAKAYGTAPFTLEAVLEWLETFGGPFRPYIEDTGSFLDAAASQGKRILFEAQLGALRDVDFGIYPYTSSSSTIAAYAPIGAGVPGRRLDRTIGIMKAYSSSVGGGPFVCEMFGPEGDALREAGDEYGAATGRPRRVGGFDVPASRYGVHVQGANELALTKLDVLGGMQNIPVCAHYDIDGELTESFPFGERLERAKPVVEYLPGWAKDISGCRTEADLPDNAKRYVSVGAGREQYLTRS
ncbi:MAG TPA: adenylosuccinate synthetase, partial [Clostridia bacterium]|nr:adenylosuccinate synthetase [Clostridia bacterium]